MIRKWLILAKIKIILQMEDVKRSTKPLFMMITITPLYIYIEVNQIIFINIT